MRYLQVFTAASAVVIFLFLTVTEVESLKYSTADLKKTVNRLCCGTSGKREENQEQMPLKKESEAKEFLTRFISGGLHRECCEQPFCTNEEVREGGDHTPDELGEECLHEGCSTEEIVEHCTN